MDHHIKILPNLGNSVSLKKGDISGSNHSKENNAGVRFGGNGSKANNSDDRDADVDNIINDPSDILNMKHETTNEEKLSNNNKKPWYNNSKLWIIVIIILILILIGSGLYLYKISNDTKKQDYIQPFQSRPQFPITQLQSNQARSSNSYNSLPISGNLSQLNKSVKLKPAKQKPTKKDLLSTLNRLTTLKEDSNDENHDDKELYSDTEYNSQKITEIIQSDPNSKRSQSKRMEDNNEDNNEDNTEDNNGTEHAMTNAFYKNLQNNIEDNSPKKNQ